MDRSPSGGRGRLRRILEGQWLHLLYLVVVGGGTLAVTRCGRVFEGELWGIPSAWWFLAALAVPVAHQVYVWLGWRVELHGKLLSRWLGEAAFSVYSVPFFAFLLLRVAVVWALAAAEEGTVAAPRWLLDGLALLLAVPFLYAFYSVGRYFGFQRAAGLDHFEPSLRERGLVRRGIFRFTSNGMYIFGFLGFWVLALAYASTAALVAAAFGHAYIWIHYFATERPDLRRIYGQERSTATGDQHESTEGRC